MICDSRTGLRRDSEAGSAYVENSIFFKSSYRLAIRKTLSPQRTM